MLLSTLGQLYRLYRCMEEVFGVRTRTRVLLLLCLELMRLGLFILLLETGEGERVKGLDTIFINNTLIDTIEVALLHVHVPHNEDVVQTVDLLPT